MLKPDLLMLASNCSVISICFICCLLVYPGKWQSARLIKGSDRNHRVSLETGLEWKSHYGQICPTGSGFHGFFFAFFLTNIFPQSLTFTLLSQKFLLTHFEQSAILLHYINSKNSERRERWQMRLFLSGLAYGSNQGKWGSAGPTVISRRPHVHVSFNSSTQTSVD